MNLTIECEDVSITPDGYKSISVEIRKADLAQLMENFTIKDIVGHFNVGELLDEIGQSEVERHFDLIEKPNE